MLFFFLLKQLGKAPIETAIGQDNKILSKNEKKNRRQQDSNLRRQSPTDFESVSLTTRTYRRFQFGNMIFIIMMDMSWKSVSKHKIRALSTHTRVAGCMFCSNSKAIPASLQSVFQRSVGYHISFQSFDELACLNVCGIGFIMQYWDPAVQELCHFCIFVLASRLSFRCRNSVTFFCI